MSSAIKLLSVLFLVSLGWSCAYDVQRVVLPSGFPHAKKISIHVRPAIQNNYFDRVAANSVTEALLRWQYLFEVVPSIEDAELDLVATAGPSSAFDVNDFGGEIILHDAERAYNQPEIGTELSIKIVHRKEGVIYDNQHTLHGHPNIVMDNAAEHLMIRYATGH